MNNIHLDTKHQVYWLSYEWFETHGISENTYSSWCTRNVCIRKYIDGKAYINYDTIPEPTRVKLPTKDQIKEEYNRQRFGYMEKYFTRELQNAHKSIKVGYLMNEIRKNEDYRGLKPEQIAAFARKAAVIEKAVYLQNESSATGALAALFYAYQSIYPNDYSMKNRFCMALKRAREEGILSVAIDKRIFRKVEPKYGEEHTYAAEFILSLSKSYSLPKCYDYFKEYCEKNGLQVPHFDWLRLYYRKNKVKIERSRMGEEAWQKENRTYLKIIPALFAGDQWQMDGWRIPIYCKRRNDKGGMEYFVTYNLFAVMDAHSRRIIGYDIAESENTENILKGLERAVETTGTLPYEIVADNHAWNKTKEADNFKEETERLGVHWTIDSNPRRKAILERSFRTLGDNHFKTRYGYIGQGVKTKIKNGLTQKELMKIYTQPENFLTLDQVKMVVISVVNEYNNSLIKKLNDTPNSRYEKSSQPSSIPVDMFARLALFYRETEHKVTHGQITIKRGMHTYEYQLSSEYSVQYNGKQVGVRYVDFDEIYLYDLETNESICSVLEKSGVHGALANQTDADKELLLKNSGRTKGIDSKHRKRKESIFDEANTLNPNAYDSLNAITAPKDIIQEVRQNQALRNEALKHGIYPETLAPLPQVDEMLDSSLKPRKKENRSPFRSKGEVEMKKIILED